MSEIITVQKKNHSMLQLGCESGVAMELNEFFSFFVDGYKFMPAYKNKVWDGKIRLFNRMNYELPVGLYHYLTKFSKDRGYTIELEDGPVGYPDDKDNVDPQQLYEFINTLNLHSRGEKIAPRSYQFEAVYEAAKNKRRVLISPTGSGKSLIIYILARLYMATHEGKVLVIVPTTSLVEQMYSDFDDYASKDETFSAKEDCHTIFSGKPKNNIAQRIVISTWQSLYKLPQTWFNQFGLVFGDECHGFKAKSLTQIMNKCQFAAYRYGTTGTLDGTQVNQLVLEGLFGKVYRVTTTKELQDDNTLADLEISMLVLKHPKDVIDNWANKSYQDEVDYLVRSKARNEFIRNLAIDRTGNTLVLFQYVDKHGKPLFDMIRDAAQEGRKVFFVSGEVETSDREAIRHIVEKEKNAIIVASMGTFSTGINIRNLHNIIFASPSKSQIRVLQSIGRGLRKSDDGSTTNLYDIVDELKNGKEKNFAFMHGAHRLKIYEKEQFKYKIYNLDLRS